MDLQRTLRHLAPEASHRRRTMAMDLLGADHPFVAADGAFRQAARNLTFTAVFAAALAAFAYPERSAAVMAPAAFVLLYLALQTALAADQHEEAVMELVLRGAESLPIGPVARVRRSLLGHRVRTSRSLVRMLDRAAAQATRHPADRRAPILDAATELIEVAALLRRTRSARAVALTQRLLNTTAGWHMLAFEPDALARELGRIRFLLLADEAEDGA
jgi:hypothetical protein